MQRGSGAVVALAGFGLVGVGVWARWDVRRSLARERIVMTLGSDAAPALVRSPGAARALAEMIRAGTVEAADGRTYAETDQYLAADGSTTSDVSLALLDERTGRPVDNPAYELWIRSTALQTALMQAYLAFRIADLSIALGAALVATGAGITARR